ncbi:MAG: hypothetical protein J2P37_17195 [Ktedonobacteraceae bacterium]|nr:hypothetical protein [Ktedonobacteraceae bacterium]MBO0796069.1 hypothetical protein [Ktedonobacteraceae bacterium]
MSEIFTFQLTMTPSDETPLPSIAQRLYLRYPEGSVELLNNDCLRLTIKQEAWTPADMDFFNMLHHQGYVGCWKLTGSK